MDIFLLPVLLGLVVATPLVRPAAVLNPLPSAELHLTPAQQEQIQEIQTLAEADAVALLTPEQQAHWTRDSLWRPSPHLALTPEQIRQLAALRLRTLSQIYHVLTPHQQSQARR
ncbi:MAG: hypothetical protein Q6K14_10280 [Gloeomargarita sp. GMQP_bins_44]